MALSLRLQRKLAKIADKARGNKPPKRDKVASGLSDFTAKTLRAEKAITEKLKEKATKASRLESEKFVEQKSRERLVFKKVKFDYKPSKYARQFHLAKEYPGRKNSKPPRFRALIWGIKSGKTQAGAIEFCQYALTHPNELGWVVAPTIKQTETCEDMIKEILFSKPDLVVSYNQVKRQMVLFNNFKIEFRTASKPDRLRGPNVHIAWIDEGAFISLESYLEIRKRTAATRGIIFITTTPCGKNWLWDQIVASEKRPGLMPPAAPYGEFTFAEPDSKGDIKIKRWVSHRPTWHFPWVDHEELEEQRDATTKEYFDQEWGALFTARIDAAFKNIKNLYTQLDRPEPSLEQKYAIGVDLGRKQDYTAVVVLDADGRVVDTDRWQFSGWKHTRRKLKSFSTKWNTSFLCVDAANMGDVIQEDLREDGYQVFPIQMNSWRVKADLIQYLQLCIEHKYIKITDPSSPFSTEAERYLISELEDYQAKPTAGGRMSYSAAAGKHDDFVVALAIAAWGRKLGFAGGILQGSGVSIRGPRKEPNPVKRLAARSRRHSKLQLTRRRRSSCGHRAVGSIWRGVHAA